MVLCLGYCSSYCECRGAFVFLKTGFLGLKAQVWECQILALVS